MTEMPLEARHEALRDLIRDLQSVAVAFSGGVDSTLLLRVAADVLGTSRVVAVTGRSHSIAMGELASSGKIAEAIGVEQVVLDTDEFDDPNYTSNPVNRCYFCKDHLYLHMANFVKERKIAEIVSGTNADDLGDYRPGLNAANEHGVRAPLAEVGLTKQDVRALSRHYGLTTHDKPASPCLSSRIPYGEPVTAEKLRMIEGAESFVHNLGIPECRVRHHGQVARIEVPIEWIPLVAEPANAARIDGHFRDLGFLHVSLDLRPFKSGSLNEVISIGVATKD